MQVAGGGDGHRDRITRAAAQLLRSRGIEAVTTRGVAEAAGVQAPTIYRLFGDKDGLLEAVAEHVMATQVAAKESIAAVAADGGVDPLHDFTDAWRAQIAFGLENPALFRLLSDPERVRSSPAAQAGRQVLAARIHRLALAGRLRVSEERAVDIVQAGGVGTVQALLAAPPERRDPSLGDAMYAGVLSQILHAPPADRPGSVDPVRAAAVALRAAGEGLPGMTDAERRLLIEWLDRIIERG